MACSACDNKGAKVTGSVICISRGRGMVKAIRSPSSPNDTDSSYRMVTVYCLSFVFVIEPRCEMHCSSAARHTCQLHELPPQRRQQHHLCQMENGMFCSLYTHLKEYMCGVIHTKSNECLMSNIIVNGIDFSLANTEAIICFLVCYGRRYMFKPCHCGVKLNYVCEYESSKQ